jgi:pyrroline-5-carboxylate reductase
MTAKSAAQGRKKGRIDMTKLGFIGIGNMGGAILRGIQGKLGNTAVFAYDANEEKLKDLNLVGATAASSIKEIAERCDYIVLSVKPQQLDGVLTEAKEFVKPTAVFISICAGISAEYIRERTSAAAKVVLVMPNTPMMLGFGASAMSRDESVSDEEFAFARRIIGSCGITEVVPSDKMKEVIAVNGSSPAFIYLYAKGFVDYAAGVGIDKDAALRLFAQTLIGSAKMLTESGMTVDELIKQVSSPGGTTLAGLDKLYEGKLTDVVKSACEACTKRAYELGQK